MPTFEVEVRIRQVDPPVDGLVPHPGFHIEHEGSADDFVHALDYSFGLAKTMAKSLDEHPEDT